MIVEEVSSSIYVSSIGVDPAIIVRKNSSSSKSMGCYASRKAVVLKQLKDFESWKNNVS
jgi:hypothetical protein